MNAPNVWARAVARAEQIEQTTSATHDSAVGLGHRVTAAVVAFAVFAAAALFAWQAFSNRPVGPLVRVPSVDPWGSLSPGLNELPPPPSARSGPAIVWTGRELVVWGGTRNDGAVRFDDGFSFDPVDRRWISLPPSPLRARYFPDAVWTGREVLIWGGQAGPSGAHLDDGAGFDPSVGRWRLLPEAPIAYGRGSQAVWTGSEMVVWNPEEETGAAYDPASDTWRHIADALFPLYRVQTAVWTGTKLVALGMSTDGGEEETRARALSYDAATNEWTELPRPVLSENASTVVWTGSEVIGIDYNHRVQSYRPGDERWIDLPEIPARSGEFPPQAAYSSGDLVVDTFSGQIVLDVKRQVWSDLFAPKRADQLLYPIAAGHAIVLWQASPIERARTHFVVWNPSRPPGGTDPSHCEFPTLRPTYLPWVLPGKKIPAPHETYDDQIDRAQLGWSDPRFPRGTAGVGLTVYTHVPQGNRGEKTEIVVRGVAGWLHGPGDGGGVSVSWDLQTSTCNLLELSYDAPHITTKDAIQQLVRIARSLQ